MRPIRCLATALLVASLAVAGCARSQPDEAATPADQPPAAATRNVPAPSDDSNDSPRIVLADGRHPVHLKSIDLSGQTITFDLIQLYWNEEASREAAKDGQIADNDYYGRNVNHKLRTLPVRTDAPITFLTGGNGSGIKTVPASLDELATAMGPAPYGPPYRIFYITVHHDQVVKIVQQYLP